MTKNTASENFMFARKYKTRSYVCVSDKDTSLLPKGTNNQSNNLEDAPLGMAIVLVYGLSIRIFQSL